MPAPAGEALRDYLRARLPEYMIPAHFMAIDRVPLTPNGKVDRQRLPVPGVPAARARVAPRTPTEEAIAGIWREVLGVDEVGVRDDFFELGGHSLVATRVLSRLGSSLNVDLPLRVLFQAPTVETLARFVDAARGEATEQEEISL
ncbi:MAG: hypothetical protein IPJ28_15270 [Betaproteobacteria bacterium]|nr:hypothetical protein [Betaproteobacteria bacterium]